MDRNPEHGEESAHVNRVSFGLSFIHENSELSAYARNDCISTALLRLMEANIQFEK